MLIRVNKTLVAKAALRDCAFQEMSHPPYPPDLALSDFHLFRILKGHLRGKQFKDDNELKTVRSGQTV